MNKNIRVFKKLKILIITIIILNVSVLIKKYINVQMPLKIAIKKLTNL
jgi:hypothetical protein